MYDVAQEGITRMQNIQMQFDNSREDNVRLANDNFKLTDLFDAFRSGTDHEATTLLARLRLGESIDELLSFAEATELSPSRCVVGLT